jgi:hypothetical protein
MSLAKLIGPTFFGNEEDDDRSEQAAVGLEIDQGIADGGNDGRHYYSNHGSIETGRLAGAARLAEQQNHNDDDEKDAHASSANPNGAAKKRCQ